MIFQFNGKYHDLHEGKNSPELQAELESQGLITFTDGEPVKVDADGMITEDFSIGMIVAGVQR